MWYSPPRCLPAASRPVLSRAPLDRTPPWQAAAEHDSEPRYLADDAPSSPAAGQVATAAINAPSRIRRLGEAVTTGAVRESCLRIVEQLPEPAAQARERFPMKPGCNVFDDQPNRPTGATQHRAGRMRNQPAVECPRLAGSACLGRPAVSAGALSAALCCRPGSREYNIHLFRDSPPCSTPQASCSWPVCPSW